MPGFGYGLFDETIGGGFSPLWYEEPSDIDYGKPGGGPPSPGPGSSIDYGKPWGGLPPGQTGSGEGLPEPPTNIIPGGSPPYTGPMPALPPKLGGLKPFDPNAPLPDDGIPPIAVIPKPLPGGMPPGSTMVILPNHPRPLVAVPNLNLLVDPATGTVWYVRPDGSIDPRPISKIRPFNPAGIPKGGPNVPKPRPVFPAIPLPGIPIPVPPQGGANPSGKVPPGYIKGNQPGPPYFSPAPKGPGLFSPKNPLSPFNPSNPFAGPIIDKFFEITEPGLVWLGMPRNGPMTPPPWDKGFWIDPPPKPPWGPYVPNPDGSIPSPSWAKPPVSPQGFSVPGSPVAIGDGSLGANAGGSGSSGGGFVKVQ